MDIWQPLYVSIYAWKEWVTEGRSAGKETVNEPEVSHSSSYMLLCTLTLL